MNEAAFAQILDGISEGVVVFTQDGDTRYFNRAFQKLTGFDQADMHRTVGGILHGPMTDPDAITRIDAAIAAGTEFSGDILSYRKSGEAFWNSVLIQPNFNPDGTLRHFICISRDITARMEAEGKASKYERDYRFIFDNVQSAITVHDADAQIRVANPSAIELLGIDPADLTGLWPGDRQFRLCRKDGSEMPLEEYPVMQAIRQRVPVRGAVLGYHRAKDDRHLWLVCSAYPVLHKDGGIAEVLLSFSDITRLVESEAEAQRLRERFELAARATQDAVFEWDVRTGMFWANDAYKDVYGYEPPEFITIQNLENTSAIESEHDKVREITLNAINSGAERYSLDYEFRRADGPNGHAAVRAFIVRDANGVAQRIIGTATDIGRLTRANAALEQSETRFRLIADSASDVLWDHDFESGLTWSSPDWPLKLGVAFDPADIQNFKWVEMVDLADRQELVASFQNAIKSDATNWEVEFKARHADGQAIDLAAKASILRNPDGRATRILGNMRNVTLERRNQEGYTRARALEAVGQLTGGVAHDFNNLLMIILGNLELLEMNQLSDADAETVAIITQAAESAATLTRQLLTFARQHQLNSTRVDLEALIVDTVTLLRSGLPNTISLSHVIFPDVWPVDVDANGLQQAIVNLAMNANDAMPRGGEIVLRCANLETFTGMGAVPDDLLPGRYVVISFSDTGEGMAPKVLSRAFEPFFTTKDIGKGTGLGLSTVYGFAKHSGGSVLISSEEQRGTTVHLYLPACDDTPPQTNETEAHIERDCSSDRKRILVVEDEPQVRAQVAKALQKLGYAVTLAPDGASALAMVQGGEEFDLVFTDVMMPGGMNGQELGEALSEIDPGIRILYTSGYPASAFDGLIQEGKLRINFLAKPYRTVELKEKIASVFAGSVR